MKTLMVTRISNKKTRSMKLNNWVIQTLISFSLVLHTKNTKNNVYYWKLLGIVVAENEYFAFSYSIFLIIYNDDVLRSKAYIINKHNRSSSWFYLGFHLSLHVIDVFLVTWAMQIKCTGT
jgi:hypothetical protein